MSRTEYQYVCLKCGKRYPGSAAEQSFRLDCDDCGAASLLEAEYAAGEMPNFNPQYPGFFRYRAWLPVHRTLTHSSLPILRQSKAVAAKFGLQDLDLLFSGYSEDSDLRSATFKEFEAYSVFSYIHGGGLGERVLVVASAGNTARAFAEVALRENLAVLLVVPDNSLQKMKLSLPLKKDSRVVFVASTHKHDNKPSEYAEAIAVAKVLCESPKFFPEGGVKNIARRDGLGVGYLHAQCSRWLQRPNTAPYRYYFQAIGSGTGAIGSYSMYRRLKRAGRIPAEHQLSLMLAQNAPFMPVVEHWRAGKKEFCPYKARDSLARNEQIVASVLANRNPPYAVVGGLEQLLRESGGKAFAVTNGEIAAMQELFASEEGLDIMPAAAVAAAAAQQAAASGQIDKSQPVLLHLTGGGQKQFDRDFPQCHEVQAACTVDLSDLKNSAAQRQHLRYRVEKLFGF